MRQRWRQAGNAGLGAPLLWCALGAACGILAADGSPLWFVLLLPCFLAFAGNGRPGWFCSLGVVACALLFWSLHDLRLRRIAHFPLGPALEQTGYLEISGSGWVDGEPEATGEETARTILRLESCRIAGTDIPLPYPARVVCRIRHARSDEIAYGSALRFTGRLTALRPARSPGAFDPSVYYFRSADAVGELAIRPGDRLDADGPNRGHPLRRAAIRSREWMETALLHGVSEERRDLAGVVLTMSLGAREESPEQIEEFFRLSGTMHLFAVSGLHVGVVALLLWFGTKWAGLSRRHAVLLIIPAVLFYALLTGLRPSSFRAAVMLSVVLLGFALRRKSSPANGIGLAGLVLLAGNTQPLFLPGFQLSFCVVLFITQLARPLATWLHRPFSIDPFLPRRRVPRWRNWSDQAVRYLAAGLAVSLASWLGSAGLMNAHFQAVAPAGLIANVIMVPLAGLVVITAGIAVTFFALRLSFITAILNGLNLVSVASLAALAHFFAGLPGAHFHTGGGSEPALSSADLVLEVMGVGGESAILARDDNRVWMIDSGGERTFRSQVLPLLREQGINRIDAIVLSHGDSGHIGAAPYLVAHLSPALLLESDYPNRSRIYPRIDGEARQRGIRRLRIEAGDRLRWDEDTVWEVVFPGETRPPTGLADDRCLVLRLRRGPWRILLTGDTGFLVEKDLLRSGRDLRADVWIRGQHATAASGSGELLERIRPRVVITSHDDFPPQERLEPAWIRRIEDSGARLIRLDEAGSVRVEIGDDELRVKPFLPEAGDAEILKVGND